jgi:glucose/arabinose dehydrogenase
VLHHLVASMPVRGRRALHRTVTASTRRARPVAVAVVVTVIASGCGADEPAAPSIGSAVTLPPTSISTLDSASPTVAAATTLATTAPTSTQPASPFAKVVASGLEVPWSIAFLPDGTPLVTERDSARILELKADGQTIERRKMADARSTGEGGLLGIAVSPKYANDGYVYAYYTTETDNRITRFHLDDSPEQVLLAGIPKASNHDGGRLAFGPDGLLYATTGDAGKKELAQDGESLAGKILRLNPDGSIPTDNPSSISPMYSKGHRNVQGLAWDDQGRLWASEFGQNTTDELNLIEPGKNYGWPDCEGMCDKEGMTNPALTWPTSDASPSGLAFWKGDLYMAALKGKRLWRIPVTAAGAGKPEALLQDAFGRLRAVVTTPNGSLWITTSNRDGRGEPKPNDDQILSIIG